MILPPNFKFFKIGFSFFQLYDPVLERNITS